MHKLILGDNFISWKEATAIIGVCQRTFYKLAKDNCLSKKKIFNHVYYHKDDIIRLKEYLEKKSERSRKDDKSNSKRMINGK